MITFSKIGEFGRLGNQMFQYATLIGVSEKTGFDYGIKIHKNINEFLNFVLDEAFDINFTIFNDEIKYQYKEPYYHFCKNIFDIKDNTNIHGYFQSPKYFEHCKKKILDTFKFKEKWKTIKYGKNFTSIHIRRGDYVGCCNFVDLTNTDYYQKAMEIINDDNYLVFSDDIEWCKNNFKFKNIEYAENINNYECMYLMSICKNNIISNSSFSWWGAYLNQNSKVIASKKWFGEKRNLNDLFLKKWHVI